MQRVQESGLKLNKEKCQFGVREVVFLGDKISGEGVEPLHSKVQAIQEMPHPRDKKGVLRALVLINMMMMMINN